MLEVLARFELVINEQFPRPEVLMMEEMKDLRQSVSLVRSFGLNM
jgi:hypothetical protein